MQLACPHCKQVLEYSGGRPKFCAYCGKSIHTSDLEITQDYDGETPSQVRASPDQDSARARPQLAGYRFIRPLGEGGMGSVYEAEEESSGRRVAIKLISSAQAASRDAVERFRQEGRLASTIAHPRCVFVLGADEEAGRPYIVMELMPGATLKDLVEREGPLSPENAVAKILDVIEGLEEAHRCGVIHRDVKPNNCFLEKDGRVKIGDFGLSKSLESDLHLTQAGTFLGTPPFASPEQIKREAVDSRTDVYSTAATLYYLLTGKAPHQTTDLTATMLRSVTDPAPSMRTLCPGLSRALDRVVLRGLERNREARWRDLEAFRSALLRFAQGQLAPGKMGIRFGAYFLDAMILSPVGLVYGFLISREISGEIDRLPVQIFALTNFLFCFAYFTALDGLWGGTVGKRWLGLRVCRLGSPDAPGIGRGFLRSLAFFFLISVSDLVLILLFDFKELAQNSWHYLVVNGSNLVSKIVGIGLVMSTMRAHNGFRGLHEFISGTRVILLPEGGRRRPFPIRKLDEHLIRPAGMPERIGAFAIQGAMRWKQEDKLLLGKDESLGRDVLVWMAPRLATGLTTKHHDITRPTRLRWLGAGLHEDMAWTAFLAPKGCSLPALVASRGKLTWGETRGLLEQLAEELATASTEGSLPPNLSLEQLWVQPDGRVLLLETQIDDEPRHDVNGTGGTLTDQERALRFLGEVTVLALEGKSRPPDAAPVPIRAPVPSHARQMISWWLGVNNPPRSVKDVQADLHATQGNATEVSRGRRVAHLAILTPFLGLGLFWMLVVCGSVPDTLGPIAYSVGTCKEQLALDDLHQGAWREAAVASLNPDPWARLGRAVQLNSDLRMEKELARKMEWDQYEREARVKSLTWFEHSVFIQQEAQIVSREKNRYDTVTWLSYRLQNFRHQASGQAQFRYRLDEEGLRNFTSIFLIFWPAAWVLWAFLTRGGFSYRLAGTALVQADGRKASIFRCAWRAVLVWLPFTALLYLSIWLEGWYWLNWAPYWSDVPGPERFRWAHWLSWGIWWAGVGLLPIYAALAFLFPTRSVHDRLAGTYLVPN